MAATFLLYSQGRFTSYVESTESLELCVIDFRFYTPRVFFVLENGLHAADSAAASGTGQDLWPRTVAEFVACSPFPGIKSWAFPKIIAESATRAYSETESAMPLLLLIRPPNVASKYPESASPTLNASYVEGVVGSLKLCATEFLFSTLRAFFASCIHVHLLELCVTDKLFKASLLGPLIVIKSRILFMCLRCTYPLLCCTKTER